MKKYFLIFVMFVIAVSLNVLAATPHTIWGLEHKVKLQLNFDPASAAAGFNEGGEVEFGCAHGTLGKVSTDGKGGFIAQGDYVLENAGPARGGQKPDQHKALYVGFINSSGQLNLTVYLYDDVGDALSFDLQRDLDTILFKCQGSASGSN